MLLIVLATNVKPLLKNLKKEDFYEGDLYWQAQYHLLEEPLVYPVTDDFPRITPFKFVGGANTFRRDKIDLSYQSGQFALLYTE